MHYLIRYGRLSNVIFVLVLTMFFKHLRIRRIANYLSRHVPESIDQVENQRNSMMEGSYGRAESTRI